MIKVYSMTATVDLSFPGQQTATATSFITQCPSEVVYVQKFEFRFHHFVHWLYELIVWLIDWKLNESYIFLNEKKNHTFLSSIYCPECWKSHLGALKFQFSEGTRLRPPPPPPPRKRGLMAWNLWETARFVGKWLGELTEHQKQTKSVIRECHQSRGNHKIEWEVVKILDQEMVDIKRKIKEAIDIRWQRPTLNRDGGYEFLAIFNHYFCYKVTHSRDNTEH